MKKYCVNRPARFWKKGKRPSIIGRKVPKPYAPRRKPETDDKGLKLGDCEQYVHWRLTLLFLDASDTASQRLVEVQLRILAAFPGRVPAAIGVLDSFQEKMGQAYKGPSMSEWSGTVKRLGGVLHTRLMDAMEGSECQTK